MQLADWKREGHGFSYRGHRVFYRRGGSGETLVLLHGFPTASWDWHRLWAPLLPTFDVVAPDLLGFGFSDKPPDHDYSIMDQADLVESLLAGLGLRSVHLLAHDYGDSVAQELLARNDEREAGAGLRIRSVCLLNGGILPGVHRPLLVQRLLTGPLGGLLARTLSERTLRRSFRRIFGADTQPTDSELRDFWTLVEGGGGRRVIPAIMRYMAERNAHRDRWVGVLQTTPVPVRLIIGSADPISGAHMAEAYRGLVPGADALDLPGIGHYPQIEAPREVLGALLPFIEGT